MSCTDAEKPVSVHQGAVEKITPAMSDLSLKDSVKSDSTGGGRLFDSCIQSDGLTPSLAVDSAKSDELTSKSSVGRQESSSHQSDGKSDTASVKMTAADESHLPFNVVSLLQNGQTLR